VRGLFASFTFLTAPGRHLPRGRSLPSLGVGYSCALYRFCLLLVFIVAMNFLFDEGSISSRSRDGFFLHPSVCRCLPGDFLSPPRVVRPVVVPPHLARFESCFFLSHSLRYFPRPCASKVPTVCDPFSFRFFFFRLCHPRLTLSPYRLGAPFFFSPSGVLVWRFCGVFDVNAPLPYAPRGCFGSVLDLPFSFNSWLR